MKAEDVLSGEAKSVGAAVLRALLVPLALLHRAGLEVYLLPFHLGIRQRTKLPVPVISIGNLTSGGTGKTPMAALVGQVLRESGKKVAILSRGHGGSHEKQPGAKIVSRGDGAILLPPDVAGDEPVLLARLLPDVPVIVGRDRRVSGKLAVETFAPDALLLDDGLQFWQLHRDLDIVLLDARRPFDNGWTLPRGLLREPKSHLSRAGIVVLTRADRIAPDVLEKTMAEVRSLAPEAQVFTARHAPAGWIDRDGLPASAPDGEVASFSGIADGGAFAESLRRDGIILKSHSSFPDHFTYNTNVIERLLQNSPSAAYVTTEKDLVKVASLWPSAGPRLLARRIALQIDRHAPFAQTLNTAVLETDEETHSIPRSKLL